MERKKQWNNTAVLSAIFISALAARLLKLILDPMLQRDSIHYLILAERWHETGQYIQTIVDGAIVPPLPLFAIVKAMNLGLNSEIAGRSISLFLGAMIPVLGYIISCMLFRSMVASRISALVFILHPTLISYSIQPLRENSYLFFCGLIIIFAIRGIKNKKIQDWGICGFFVSCATNCRYESLELLIFCPLTIAILLINKELKLQKALLTVSCFIASFLMTSVLFLTITDNNPAFMKKALNHFETTILDNNVSNFIENDPQINE